MKKISFLFLILLASYVLTGCKSKDVADPYEVAKDLAPSMFEGTKVRTLTVVDNSVMTVDEWTVTNTESRTIQHEKRAWGDGVDTIALPVEYRYNMIGLADNNVGVLYEFVNESTNEKLPVLYWGNGFVINDDTINGSAKLANLDDISTKFPNHSWLSFSSVDTVFKDTIAWDTVYIKNIKNYDESGKLIGVKKDTVVVSQKHYFKNKLPLSTDSVLLEFNRDAEGKNSLALQYYGMKYNHENVKRVEVKDTLVSPINGRSIVRTLEVKYVSDAVPEVINLNYSDNWYLYSITSKSRFGLMHQGKTEGMEVVEDFVPDNMMLSAFSLTDGTLKVGDTEYKLVK